MNVMGQCSYLASKQSFSFFVAALMAVFSMPMSSSVNAHEGADGIVKERMDNFKKSQNNLKSIRSLIGEGDTEAIIPLAEEIRLWASRIPQYFPEGSGGAPSEAADIIWQDVEGFRGAAKRHEEAAEVLLNLAQKGEVARLNEAFAEVAGSCKACHQRFRK